MIVLAFTRRPTRPYFPLALRTSRTRNVPSPSISRTGFTSSSTSQEFVLVQPSLSPLSVHKSQGQTFRSRVLLDLGQSKKTWSTDGLLYVGLSRITDVSNLAMVAVPLSTLKRDPKNSKSLNMRLEEEKRLNSLAAATRLYYDSNAAEFDTTLHLGSLGTS